MSFGFPEDRSGRFHPVMARARVKKNIMLVPSLLGSCCPRSLSLIHLENYSSIESGLTGDLKDSMRVILGYLAVNEQSQVVEVVF